MPPLGFSLRWVVPALLLLLGPPALAADLLGVCVTPHRIEPTLRYRGVRDTTLAARVQLFVRGPAKSPTFAGKSPRAWLEADQWAWHDLDATPHVPEGALHVWSFNGKSDRWGVGHAFDLEAEGLKRQKVELATPRRWISAATFLSSTDKPQPDRLILHVVNDDDKALEVRALRLWLPRSSTTWHTLWPQKPLAVRQTIPARDRGVLTFDGLKLPLSYVALELQTDAGHLWAHLRVKRETFDVSGGWIQDGLAHDAYLDFLASLHVNAGQIDHIPGYTDKPERYRRVPMKLFNRLWPLDRWDTEEWLPRIHAVEFLGEPQYGGKKAISPQQVFDRLLPYRASRLPTSVTLSEERTWRLYAGLSDYPHYDAYRVVAPAADAWTQYDRWEGKRLRWGAPLETIGDLCRSLRELNRPVPCAYWSQGPHHGWGGFFDGRKRRSPTPDELRSQALHGLSTRITSLYWFNLSLKSLLAYPDTWEPLRRIGREIRMLAPLMLEGDAYRFERRTTNMGKPDWDLASIAAPEAVLLFALDTAYAPDPKENVFTFGPPREVEYRFALPPWLREPTEVRRVDADGLHRVAWKVERGQVILSDKRSRDALYVVVNDRKVLDAIEQRRQAALKHEAAHRVEEATLRALRK